MTHLVRVSRLAPGTVTAARAKNAAPTDVVTLVSEPVRILLYEL